MSVDHENNGENKTDVEHEIETDEDVESDDLDFEEEEEESEVHSVGDISVGGGPSSLTNTVVLGLSLLGIVFGLVSFCTSH